jgi:hypothetical protein
VSEPDAYIFQSNPREWDLPGTLGSLPRFQWRVTRYKRDIKPGDRVYMWEALPTRGILAIATITSRPRIETLDQEMIPFMRDPKKYSEEATLVRLEVDEILRTPMSHEELLNDPLTAKQPPICPPYQGTNFFVPPDRARTLGVLLAAR